MNSETVYQVAKALPKEEQILLFEKLKNDFISIKKSNYIKAVRLTKEEAKEYLLTQVFSGKGQINKK